MHFFPSHISFVSTEYRPFHTLVLLFGFIIEVDTQVFFMGTWYVSLLCVDGT